VFVVLFVLLLVVGTLVVDNKHLLVIACYTSEKWKLILDCTDRQTDRQTKREREREREREERQKERQTDKKTGVIRTSDCNCMIYISQSDRQKDRQKERQKDRQTNPHTLVSNCNQFVPTK